MTRLTMTQKRRLLRRESGQALTELVVALVGLLAVFCGFLLVSALGTENVRNIIEARESADQKARSGVSSQSNAVFTRHWDYGKDELAFTADDARVKGSNTSGDVFTEQMRDNTGALSLAASGTLDHIPLDNNYAREFAPNNLFLAAAELAHAREQESDPLGKRHLKSLKGIIKTLFSTSNYVLEDTVYMPVSPENTSNLYR